MSKKFLITVNIALGVLLLSEISLIAISLNKDRTKSINPVANQDNTKSLPTVSRNEDVPLPDGYDWIELSPDDSYSMFRDFSQTPIYASPGPQDTLKFDISGEEWIYTSENLSLDERNQTRTGLENYYSDFATNNQWSSDLTINNIRLMPLSSDSPIGSNYGYLQQKGGTVRLIQISSLDMLPEGKYLEDCPCSFSFRIFISDPIPVDTILDAAKRD